MAEPLSVGVSLSVRSSIVSSESFISLKGTSFTSFSKVDSLLFSSVLSNDKRSNWSINSLTLGTSGTSVILSSKMVNPSIN